MLRNKVFHCFGLGLMLLIVGCQGHINEDKEDKEDEQQTVGKKEVSTQLAQNPNVPADMETIRQETSDYRMMKDVVKKEKKADRALMARERLSNQERD